MVQQLVALVSPAAAAPGSTATSASGGVPDGGGRRPLLLALLRLLHNLSFSEGLRAQMVAAGLIARATALLQADLVAGGSGGSGDSGGGGEGPPLRALVLGLLYHLSLQDRHRSMFLYTGGCGSAGSGQPALCSPPPLGCWPCWRAPPSLSLLAPPQTPSPRCMPCWWRPPPRWLPLRPSWPPC